MLRIPITDVADNLSALSIEILKILKGAKNGVAVGELEKALKDKGKQCSNRVFKFSNTKLQKEIARLEGGILVKTEDASWDSRMKLYTLTEYGEEVIKTLK